MAILIRCVTGYHAGDRYIAPGTILGPNDPGLIEQYCERYEVDEPVAAKPARRARKASK